MCVRYVLRKDDLYDWIEKIESKRGEPTKRGSEEILYHGEAFPADTGTIAVLQGGALVIRPARWGMQPRWVTDTKTKKPDPHFGKRNAYNARDDSLDKPTWRVAIQQRRCIIPASGFYERTGEDGAMRWLLVVPKDRRAFGIAGMYEPPNGLSHRVTYAMITTSTHETIAHSHDRLPVILEPDDYEAWLDPAKGVDDLRRLLVTRPPERFTIEDAGPVGKPNQEELQRSSHPWA